MLEELKSLGSVRKDRLSVDSSCGSKTPKSVGEKDIRYILLSPHDAKDDPRGLDALPGRVKEKLGTINRDLLDAYLNSERDAGINELGEEILRKCRGGLRISFQINRGIIDVNRMPGYREIPDIWLPGDALVVNDVLKNIHGAALDDISTIIDRILGTRKAVQLICLHSMDTYSFEPGCRPELSWDTFKQYVDAHGLPPEQKIPRKNDFITGKRNGTAPANMEMYRSMQKAFARDGIEWAYDKPYATDAKHPDWHYMETYPGRVFVIDLTKATLCSNGPARSFDSRDATPDSDKARWMARYFKIALQPDLR